jgi:hypothetical protein
MYLKEVIPKIIVRLLDDKGLWDSFLGELLADEIEAVDFLKEILPLVLFPLVNGFLCISLLIFTYFTIHTRFMKIEKIFWIF